MGKTHRMAVRRAPRPAVALLLSCHPEPTVAVTAVTMALAATAGRSWAGVVAVGAAVLTGQLSVGWHNDWLDAERDRRTGRTDKPVARGLVPRRAVGIAAVTALALTIPCSFLSGWRAALVHLVAVGLAWSYNARLKATVLSFVPYTVAFALLPTFVCLGLPGHPGPPWWAVIGAGLLGTGAHLANALPDLDADIATGIRGLPHRLGRERTSTGAALLLLAASAVLALGPGDPGPAAVGALAVAAGVVLLALRLARNPHSRAPFRLTLVVAAIDVALLLARGTAL
ncbi:MAG: putative integral rane protein [Actinomycetia bacterium]|nr:putative integral rane protein [Actinomycetes bacterium]